MDFELIQQQRKKRRFKDSLITVTHLNHTNLISYWAGQLNPTNLFYIFFFFLIRFANYRVERQSLRREINLQLYYLLRFGVLTDFVHHIYIYIYIYKESLKKLFIIIFGQTKKIIDFRYKYRIR